MESTKILWCFVRIALTELILIKLKKEKKTTMSYQLEQVKSDMHRTLLEINFSDYKNAAREFKDICEAIELCYGRGDNADNLKVIKSKLVWRMKRIDAEYSSIIESYKRWERKEERKQSILKMKCCPKMKKAMDKFRMHYFEAMQFVKDNPHPEDSEDEQVDIVRCEFDYDQDTPPDDYEGYNLYCSELEEEMPPSAALAPPIQ